LPAASASLTHAGPKIERWQTAAGVQVLLVENHRCRSSTFRSISLPARHMKARAGGRRCLDAHAARPRRRRDGRDADRQPPWRISVRELSGGVDLDRASLRLRTLSMADKLGPAIDLLRAILSRPAFPDAVFEREQARSVAALKEALTRPETIASQAFWAAMYPAHPYGRQATPASVAALLRSDVLAFHAARYTAQARPSPSSAICRARRPRRWPSS
jgi:zinc protease